MFNKTIYRHCAANTQTQIVLYTWASLIVVMAICLLELTCDDGQHTTRLAIRSFFHWRWSLDNKNKIKINMKINGQYWLTLQFNLSEIKDPHANYSRQSTNRIGGDKADTTKMPCGKFKWQFKWFMGLLFYLLAVTNFGILCSSIRLCVSVYMTRRVRLVSIHSTHNTHDETFEIYCQFQFSYKLGLCVALFDCLRDD